LKILWDCRISPRVIASEAKQSHKFKLFCRPVLDCFVTPFLAMTPFFCR
jgi:hypothetical protein